MIKRKKKSCKNKYRQIFKKKTLKKLNCFELKLNCFEVDDKIYLKHIFHQIIFKQYVLSEKKTVF